MGYPNKKLKTEHSGAKHGMGAFYGRKQEAKECSNKHRRHQDRLIAQGIVTDSDENEEDFYFDVD